MMRSVPTSESVVLLSLTSIRRILLQIEKAFLKIKNQKRCFNLVIPEFSNHNVGLLKYIVYTIKGFVGLEIDSWKYYLRRGISDRRINFENCMDINRTHWFTPE